MADLPSFESSSSDADQVHGPWYRQLNRYHWFVFTVAALGWLFDTMDQQLFNLARRPAMQELVGRSSTAEPTPEEAKAIAAQVNYCAGLATSIFLVGWAAGGLFFGVLGDRIGRAKTMLLTILVYSIFTGLSAFSTGFWDFAIYRFLTGLGVGGEFAVGVTLVAEVMPDRARPFALGLLQALSAVGNISAALIGMATSQLEAQGSIGAGWGWRAMFVVGTLPALLAIVIRRRLKEPERWQTLRANATEANQLGSYAELFGDPRWRHRALVGMVLASSGVIGLWGIGFFSFDLFRSVFQSHFQARGLSPEQVAGQLGFWVGVTSIMQNLGGFFGIYAFSMVTQYTGRRPAFAVSFILALLSTALVFWGLDQFSEIFWMIPLMGFCQLALFGGYAIYFPELFPTRLRSTGTSFCYNVGRFVAAIGPYLFGYLTSSVFRDYPQPMRPAGIVMCAIFLLGLAALPFAPETKGKPLPE